MLRKSDKAQTLFDEPQAYDPIDAQRIVADAAYLRARTVSGLLDRAIRWAGGAVNDYLVSPVAERLRIRRAYRELMALDDRMLADIGISRNDIPHVAAGSAVRGGPVADVHFLKSIADRIPGAPEKTDRPLAA